MPLSSFVKLRALPLLPAPWFDLAAGRQKVRGVLIAAARCYISNQNPALTPGKVHKIGVRLCAPLVRLRLNLDSTAGLHGNLAKQRLVLLSLIHI